MHACAPRDASLAAPERPHVHDVGLCRLSIWLSRAHKYDFDQSGEIAERRNQGITRLSKHSGTHSTKYLSHCME